MTEPLGDSEAIGNQPPDSWFMGVGRTGRGIEWITRSPEFAGLHNGVPEALYSEWEHIDGLLIAFDEDEKQFLKSPDTLPPDLRQRYLAAEQRILELTGFTPRQIEDRRKKLVETYRGKTIAPFAVEIQTPQ